MKIDRIDPAALASLIDADHELPTPVDTFTVRKIRRLTQMLVRAVARSESEAEHANIAREDADSLRWALRVLTLPAVSQRIGVAQLYDAQGNLLDVMDQRYQEFRESKNMPILPDGEKYKPKFRPTGAM